MAIAYKCDICGKLMDSTDLKICLDGYWVYHGVIEKKAKKRYGDYGLLHPETICSFSCLSAYAEREQKIIDDIESILSKSKEET